MGIEQNIFAQNAKVNAAAANARRACTKGPPLSASDYVQRERTEVTGYAPQKDEGNLGANHRGTLFRIVNGGDIKAAYTLVDKLRMAWAEAAQSIGSVPGAPRWMRSATKDTGRTIEHRLLAQEIITYRGVFGQRLDGAKHLRGYLRDQIDTYAAEEAQHKRDAIENESAAATIDEQLRKAQYIVDTLKDQAPQTQDIEERRAMQHTIIDAEQGIKEYLASWSGYNQKALRHVNGSKISAIRHTSLLAMYRCVSSQASLLEERGEHIERVLKDHEAGATIEHTELLREAVKQCRIVSNTLLELDKKYAGWHEQEQNSTNLRDDHLDAAYNDSETLRRTILDDVAKDRVYMHAATDRVVLGPQR